MSTLSIEGLGIAFRGFRAVDGVDLVVEPGERRAVIGPNGAGKTTLFNLLTGRLTPDAGRVTLGDRDITGLAPHDIVRAGIGRAFQVTSIFPRLTVRQNVQAALIAAHGSARRLGGIGWRRHVHEADRILGEVGIGELAGTPAGTVSHGDQRALELALALALDPRVLLLDEPTAGMAPAETANAMELVRRVVAERGLTLLFCEHDMDVVFGTADRVTVMHHGKLLAEGTPEQVRAHAGVREVYLGSAA